MAKDTTSHNDLDPQSLRLKELEQLLAETKQELALKKALLHRLSITNGKLVNQNKQLEHTHKLQEHTITKLENQISFLMNQYVSKASDNDFDAANDDTALPETIAEILHFRPNG